MPSKIVTELLEPIDIAQFGDDPEVEEVDAHVRGVMQSALDRLANQRRFPVLGQPLSRESRSITRPGSVMLMQW